MFRRNKDNDDADKGGEATEDLGAPPLKPFSRKGAHMPAKPPVRAPFRVETPRRIIDIPGVPRGTGGARTGVDEGKTLTVGRDIRLNGEITSCDRLVVEGSVEVELSDARIIEVSPTGVFRGSAHVDEADISGRFEGELIAREKLTVRSTGCITGSIRYGRIVIESGGEISGDMHALTPTDQAPPPGGGTEPGSAAS